MFDANKYDIFRSLLIPRYLDSERKLEVLMSIIKPLFKTPRTRLVKFDNFTDKVFFKLEGENICGSFKDRVAEKLIIEARHRGFNKIFTYTSGNLGLSVSKLAKENNIFSHVVINNKDYTKIDLLSKQSSVLEYRSSEPSFRSRVLSFVCALLGVWDFYWFRENFYFFEEKRREGFFVAFPSIYVNSDSLMAYSEISWEIFKQLKGKRPDYIITPVINSDNAIGQWLGYYALYKYGLITSLPTFVLVSRKKRIDHFNYPDAWRLIRNMSQVLEFGVSASEERKASLDLRRLYNINAENVSAGVWVAYEVLKKRGIFGRDSLVVLLISGSNV